MFFFRRASILQNKDNITYTGLVASFSDSGTQLPNFLCVPYVSYIVKNLIAYSKKASKQLLLLYIVKEFLNDLGRLKLQIIPKLSQLLSPLV